MPRTTDKYIERESSPLFMRQILRKIFLEDWVMKLVALVITVALWLGVTGLSTPTTKRFTVPLNFSISNNTEITNTPIQEVDVVVSGDKRKIDQINRAELAASIDLTDVTPGDKVLSLSPENVAVALPLGISSTRYSRAASPSGSKRSKKKRLPSGPNWRANQPMGSRFTPKP